MTAMKFEQGRQDCNHLVQALSYWHLHANLMWQPSLHLHTHVGREEASRYVHEMEGRRQAVALSLSQLHRLHDLEVVFPVPWPYYDAPLKRHHFSAEVPLQRDEVLNCHRVSLTLRHPPGDSEVLVLAAR